MSTYLELENQNINKSLISYDVLTPFEIKEYMTDENPSIEINEENLNKINNILDSIYSKLSGYRNVFVMTQVLEKYFLEDSSLILDIKANIVGKLNSSFERSGFELYDEIFNEIVTTLINQMFLEQMENYISGDDIIRKTFDTNEGLNNLYDDILNNNV